MSEDTGFEINISTTDGHNPNTVDQSQTVEIPQDYIPYQTIPPIVPPEQTFPPTPKDVPTDVSDNTNIPEPKVPEEPIKKSTKDALVKINEEYIHLYHEEKEKNEALTNINSLYKVENDGLKQRIADLEKLIDSYEMIIRLRKSVTSTIEPIPEEKKPFWKRMRQRN